MKPSQHTSGYAWSYDSSRSSQFWFVFISFLLFSISSPLLVPTICCLVLSVGFCLFVCLRQPYAALAGLPWHSLHKPQLMATLLSKHPKFWSYRHAPFSYIYIFIYKYI